MPKILTVEEVSVLLGTHPKTVLCWLRSGRLPGAKAPGGWRVVEQDLLDFLRGATTEQRPL